MHAAAIWNYWLAPVLSLLYSFWSDMLLWLKLLCPKKGRRTVSQQGLLYKSYTTQGTCVHLKVLVFVLQVYHMPGSSDNFVTAFRTWLNKYGGGGPFGPMDESWLQVGSTVSAMHCSCQLQSKYAGSSTAIDDSRHLS
jgi:hypothetical protein